MVAFLLKELFLFLISTLLSLSPAVLCHSPAILILERPVPAKARFELDQLRDRDRIRHGRILQTIDGVVDFPVDGTYDPYLVGLYFTRVNLGNPAREFYVQIDTGSDVLWVSCSSCDGCPKSSGLQISLNFFDPASSSTASVISCSDRRCGIGRTSDIGCSGQNNQCSYSFQYGDGSGTSGFYVSDVLHFDTIPASYYSPNASANIVFGCSTSQAGDLTKSDRAVDGIFGFGQQDMSIISQLSAQGLAPKVFSHCLRGDDGGGGILVLGEIVEPGIVYSPLVPEQAHYNLMLESVAVNGQILPIDSSVFATSNSQGTIIDSGTTLAYLAEEAYDPFVNAISDSVAHSVSPVAVKGSPCYVISSSVNEVFPTVSLNFARGASMVLQPEDYLMLQSPVGGGSVWCMGFQKIEGQRMTILGDLVLKNKIVVYDLAGQRIGWVNYDCSMAVNVSTAGRTGTSEFVNTGQMSDSSSGHGVLLKIVVLAQALVLWCMFL